MTDKKRNGQKLLFVVKILIRKEVSSLEKYIYKRMMEAALMIVNQGLTFNQIAEKLDVDPKTISNDVERLKEIDLCLYQSVKKQLAHHKKTGMGRIKENQLFQRSKKVGQMINQGLTFEQVGKRLCVSIGTVQKDIKRLEEIDSVLYKSIQKKLNYRKKSLK